MKVAKISVVLLSALFSIAVFAAPLGEVSSENGKIFNGENYMVVKKDMRKGEQIKPHNHPGFKTLIFAVGKGSFDVTLNQTDGTIGHFTEHHLYHAYNFPISFFSIFIT